MPIPPRPRTAPPKIKQGQAQSLAQLDSIESQRDHHAALLSRSNAKATGGDGTKTAPNMIRDAMRHKTDQNIGVSMNEEGFQNSKNAYVQYLKSHPVFNRESEEAFYAEEQDPGSITEPFKTNVWVPYIKTTLYQYCRCHDDPSSERYLKMKLRRNHCPSCSLDVYHDPNAEYEWDEFNSNKGHPNGDVISQTHFNKRFHINPSKMNGEWGELTDTQKRVGQQRKLGESAQVNEVWNSNIQHRLELTGDPDGPASKRERARNGGSKYTDKRTEYAVMMENLGKTANNSKSKNTVQKRPKSALPGYPTKTEWGIRDGMPYGSADVPTKFVEGPARARREKLVRAKEEELSGNNSDLVRGMVVYTTKGNNLLELQETEKKNRIGRGLKYYKLAKEGNKNAMKVILDEEKEELRIAKQEEEQVFLAKQQLMKEAEMKLATRVSAAARMMSQTTFDAKSLKSQKQLDKDRGLASHSEKKRQAALLTKASGLEKIHEDQIKIKKKKRRKKKTVMVQEEDEKNADQTKRLKVKPQTTTKPFVSSARAVLLDSDDAADLQLTNLTIQQASYHQKIKEDQKEKEDVLKESDEKERRRSDAAKGVVIVTEELVVKKMKKKRKVKIVEELEVIEEKPASTAEEVEGSKSNEGFVLGQDGLYYIDDGTGKAPTDKKVASKPLYKTNSLWAAGDYFWLAVKKIEKPLLRLDAYRTKVYEPRVSAAVLNPGLGITNRYINDKYTRNPIEYYGSSAFNYAFEKGMKVNILGYKIYFAVLDKFSEEKKEYTVDDLEGGAFDGDNATVMKCFAQKVPDGADASNKMKVDSKTKDGRTLLMCAFEGLLMADAGMLDGASEGNEKSFKKAQASTIRKYNKTIATLMAMGADPNVMQDPSQSDGYSLMHLCAIDGNCKRILWLIAKGVSVNCVSESERISPLHLACMHGRIDAAMLLLNKGAEINKRSAAGCTPLHLAALQGGTNMTRVLLLCGARKDIWDEHGKTPYDYAVSNGRHATMESILLFNAKSFTDKEAVDFLFKKMLIHGEKSAYVGDDDDDDDDGNDDGEGGGGDADGGGGLARQELSEGGGGTADERFARFAAAGEKEKAKRRKSINLKSLMGRRWRWKWKWKWRKEVVVKPEAETE